MQNNYLHPIFLFQLFFIYSYSALNWLPNTKIIAGEAKVIFNTNISKINATGISHISVFQPYYPYNTTNDKFKHLPAIIQGLTSFQINHSKEISFNNIIINISMVGYTNVLYVNDSNVCILQLTFEYLAVDLSSVNDISIVNLGISTNKLLNGSGTRYQYQICNINTTKFNLSSPNSATFFKYLNGFNMYIQNQANFNIFVDIYYYNLTSFNLTISTRQNAFIRFIYLSVIVCDLSFVQVNYLNFIDSYVMEGKNSNRVTPPPVAMFSNNNGFNYRNFIVGLNSFDFNSSQNISFDFRTDYTTIMTNGTYDYLRFDNFNYRIRECGNNQVYIYQKNICSNSCLSFQFETYNNSCRNCSNLCLTCSNNQKNCTSCAGDNKILINQTCGCKLNYILIDSICTLSVCLSNCLTCSFISSNCTSCNLTNNRKLILNQCNCIIGFFQSGKALCQQICGDGINYKNYECDDGNNINNDGCSSICKIEQGWICSDNQQNRSICLFNTSLNINFVSCIKDPYSNMVNMSFQINPLICYLNDMDFNTIISINNLPIDSVTFFYSGGILQCQLKYNNDIQGNTPDITLSPNKLSSYFLNSSTTKYKFSVKSTNSNPAYYYSNYLYFKVSDIQTLSTAIQFIALISSFLLLFINRLVSIQLIGVIQIAYIMLTYVDYIPPLLIPFSQLIYLNGYNKKFNSINNKKLPASMQIMKISNLFLNNINVMLIILLVPLVIGLVMYFLQKKWDKIKNYYNIIGYQLSAVLIYFNLYLGMFSAFIFIKYGTWNQVNILNVVATITYIIANFIFIITFIYKNNNFGQFMSFFKDQKFQKYYMLYYYINRLILLILIGLCSQYNLIGYIIGLFPFISCIIIGIFKPYKQNIHNYRSIFNEIIILLILIYYGYLRLGQNKKLSENSIQNVLPLLQIIMLLVVIILNTGISISEQIKKRNSKKNRHQIQVKQFDTNQIQNRLINDSPILHQLKINPILKSQQTQNHIDSLFDAL